MKRTVIFVMAMLPVLGMAQVQPDTLDVGEREPTFYYWDTNWWDHYALNVARGDSSEISWAGAHTGTSAWKPEFARYCYTDSTLRVIGVAATLRFDEYHITYDDDPMENLEMEYFRLYKVDTATDDMILLAEKSWYGFEPRYYMNTSYSNENGGYWPHPVYEAYFDRPVYVTDSFYVAMTGNNNFGNPYTWSKPRVKVYIAATSGYRGGHVEQEYIPRPNHFRRKLHVAPTGNGDSRYRVTDTNWHTFHLVHGLGNPTTDPNYSAPENNDFMYLFPIIDTGFHGQRICEKPDGLSVSYISSEQVIFTWDGRNGVRWELSVADDGSTPEEGAMTECNGTVYPIAGLDTGRWHVAWVRSLCEFDSLEYSPWSDSVRFYVPGNGQSGGGTEGIGGVADAYTYVQPNPAAERVRVMSSFRIGSVEVYSLTGRQVLMQRVDGMSAELDISGLASGTYLLRIHTNHGTANKKLVVR